jgi:cytochrome b subunit of formate dehydrogenase
MHDHGTQPAQRYYRRIILFHRVMHWFLMSAFIGLAGTGLPLKLSWAPWVLSLAQAMGGFSTILFLHKTFAVVLSGCFVLHILHILRATLVKREQGILWGANSLVPQPRDLVDIAQHFRWFFGAGEKPRFDRFTYWEKFDYWAVFWGMAVIGTSGFMLWFSGFFSRFLPGWLFNYALVIHSEEAILAVLFIFTIHFFNSHIRPDKFPMDLVIFSGRVSEEELREERPLEYERLVRQGRLDGLETDPPPLWLRNYSRIIGIVVIALGISLFVLTLMALSS